MGLDFRGSKAHWSYTGFLAFRRLEADLAEIRRLDVDADEAEVLE